MRTPQFFFFRGSTPTLELALPFALGEADAAVRTLAQDGQIVLEYARGADGEGLSVPADEPDLLRIRLPQPICFGSDCPRPTRCGSRRETVSCSSGSGTPMAR